VSRRTGLGRGLAALIPPSAPETTEPPPTEPASDTVEDEDGRGTEADATDEDGPGTEDAEAEQGAPEPVDAAASPVPEGPAPTAPASPPDDGATPPAAETTAASAAATASAPEVAPAPHHEPAPTDPLPISQASLVEISPSAVVPNPRQPREVFDEEEIEGLAVSLIDMGMLQPIVVRPLSEGRYELIAGERRLRAAKLADLELIPAVVRHTDDTDLLKEALVENIQRVQLNPLEEAAAYQQMLDEFGFTQEELAERIGKSRPAISNTLRLLSLPPGVQRRVAAGVLSAGHAKALLALDRAADQERLAERIVAEGMSVRGAEEAVRLRLLDGDGGSRRGGTGSQRRMVAPGLIDLQDDLSDALEARVRITMGARKGKLSIEFGSVDDLERIVAVIAGGLESGSVPITMPEDPLD
jgi:ParB family transcriptional regulator, chromosome partitioning protein